jgi:hypothetical protein
MTRLIVSIFVIASLALACSKNVMTGKKQATAFNESDLRAMSDQQYQQFLSSNKVVSSTPANKDVDMVKRVGQRITKAAEAYLAERGKADFIKDYNGSITSLIVKK